jgi:urease accessory protein
MLTCSKLIPQGRGLAAVLLKRAATVELDWDVRQKSRFEAADSLGRRVGVFLPRGTVVRGGDVLVVEDGSLIRVVAAPQAVLRITPCAAHGSAFDLVRAAYHLGNRHVPIELHPSHLQMEPDHVLAEMLQQMHLIVTPMDTAFEPENGAYAGHGDGHRHRHAHAHDEGHHHHHDGQAHEQHTIHPPKGKPIGIAVVGAAVPHVHGPGCGHEH